ncbi:MAG: cell division protein SepF [Nanoarchaeota archaeon]|nr:cell division protein SepF [Nanoarchaeota archaeon]MEC8339452.1 cell division protein SepF [Nanoarchaeota archaeon]
MAAFLGFSKKKEEFVEDDSEDYLAISEYDTKSHTEEKVVDVKVFVLDNYENIRNILDIIRNERTMCLIDIHLLRNKDPDELKRAVDKIKKTIEAIGGELVGFHENWVLAAPKNVHIHKGKN